VIAAGVAGGASVITAGVLARLPWPQGPSPSGFAFRGISYPSYRDGSYGGPGSTAALRELRTTGADHVAIIPTQAIRTYRDAEIFPTERTESDANLRIAIADARRERLKILLKPHIDALDWKPREYLRPDNAEAWFESYTRFMEHYSRLATALGAEMLCIGCELDSLVGAPHRSGWLRMIDAVRAIYSGPLVYAATWNGAKDVSFWDAVDYIGIDAYNPLTAQPTASIEDLADAWRSVPDNHWVASKSLNLSPLAFYRSLSETHGKPVVFTEIGYRSVAGAAARPGDWRLDGPVDLDIQVRAYEAFFRVWSRESAWMKGAFLWHWVPERSPDHSEEIAKGYTPQGKPAAETIARWYGGAL
jgi:hypothetical protein